MLAVIGGIFVVIVAVLTTLALIGNELKGGFPRARFTLTLPHTLIDGHYKLAKDSSATLGRTLEKNWARSWDAKAAHGVVGEYVPTAGDRGALVVTGMYGRFKHTGKVRARVLENHDRTTSHVTLLVPPKDVTLSGSGTTVACEVLTRTWRDGKRVTYPVCAWADGNTWARVAQMTLNAAMDSDLKAAARTTLRIRSEMVKAIG
ncbi:hypothetical protein AQI88_18280 [Streptomyces cellostaticus]|uniref:Uncharacterized protein n=2 Tax=Streptomyces cellostaticus TaxID=67285 RepID=A0A101NLD0_9ACTN|nr:hypothetical protein AQI88_18280 [Streptomyces cellostaticus]GHI02133.1 hypothetical protein Scel_04540 [Streptomyces cellostaticus]